MHRFRDRHLGNTSSLLRMLITDQESDSLLLSRYVGARDEVAFEALYHRHGQMVRTVCRRYCRDSHLAADAEQGVWLVLARKASRLARPERLASWLFGVALRVARKAAGTRPVPRPTAQESVVPDASVVVMASELLRVLDEELIAIPEGERLPLVLCYLEGRTQDEAARVCGICVRTLRRRLDRGRESLRKRLTSRGVEPAAAFAAVGLASDVSFASADLPATVLGAGPVPASFAPWLTEELAMKTSTWWWRATAAAAFGLATTAVFAAAWVDQDRPILPIVTTARAPAIESPPGDLPKGAVARLGSPAFRHPGEVHRLAFSVDDRQLMAIGPAAVSRWSMPDGQVVLSAKEREKGYRHLSVASPDGKIAVELFNRDKDAPDGTLYSGRVTDLTTGRLLAEFLATYGEGQPGPYSLHGAISPDDSILAVQYCAEVSLYSLPDGKLLRRLSDEGRVFRHLVFTPDNKQLIVGSLDKLSLSVWDVGNGANRKTLTADGLGTGAISISPDGKTVVAAINRQDRLKQPTGGTQSTDYAESEFAVWDLESGKLLKRVSSDAPVKSVHCLRGGAVIGVVEPAETYGRSAVRKWSLTNGKLLWSAAADQWIHVAAASHDGTRFAAVADNGIVRLWDAATGKLQPILAGHATMIGNAAFSSDGKSVWTADNTDRRSWDPTTGQMKERHPLPEGFAGVQWDSTARVMAGTTKSDSGFGVVVFDAVAGKKLLSVSEPGQDKGHGNVSGVLSNDGSRLAVMVAREKRRHMQLWDVPGAKRLWEVPMPADWAPGHLVITSDGRVLAGTTDLVSLDAATGKQSARWDLIKTGVLPTDESNNTHLYPSRDGRVLGFVIQNVGIFLVDSRTGKLDRRIDTSEEIHWPLVFNPDGSRFATSNAFGDTGIRVWNTATGKLLARLEGSPSRILAMAFSPDGRRLVSGSIDGTSLIWDAAK